MLTVGDGSTNPCHGDSTRKTEWELVLLNSPT